MGHKSDQHAVWESVESLHKVMDFLSPTSSMHDLFQSKAQALYEYVQRLKPVPGQQGLVVLVNGQVAGFDVVSSARAYLVLHAKFIKSYALEALLGDKQTGGDRCQEKVAAFFEACKTSGVAVHPGVGCGEDHRFEGPGVAGAALVADARILHLNLYRK
jgi:hypothetical protein